jgi:hypothetical protein
VPPIKRLAADRRATIYARQFCSPLAEMTAFNVKNAADRLRDAFADRRCGQASKWL